MARIVLKPDAGVTIRASILSGLRVCLSPLDELLSRPTPFIVGSRRTKNEALFTGRVPHVRQSVRGPTKMGRSPFHRYCFAGRRMQPKARIVASGVKAFENSAFGPCTLGRTWGTRPGDRASFFDLSATPPMACIWVASTAAIYFPPSGHSGVPFAHNMSNSDEFLNPPGPALRALRGLRHHAARCKGDNHSRHDHQCQRCPQAEHSRQRSHDRRPD
jgi:hypothetical protein